MWVEGNEGYLQHQPLTDIMQRCQQLQMQPDFAVLPTANLLILLKDGAGYVLASVKPPNRVVTCYLAGRQQMINTDVTNLFELIQTDAECWCNIF